MDNGFSLEQDEVTLGSSFKASPDVPQAVIQLLPEQQKNLELLSHLASYSELLIVVSGPTGVGKTTLAQALVDQRQVPEESLVLQADIMMGMLAILKNIAAHWGMMSLPDNLAEAKETIRDASLRRAEDGESLLVVIDQAEQLDVDTLNDIAHAALLAPQSLSFALFGAPGFEKGFRESPTLAPVHNVKIAALTAADAQQLADQVFSSGALTEEQVRFAYLQSEGLPLIFLRELEDLLLAGDGRKSGHKAVGSNLNRFPLTHIFAVTAVAAALLLSFLYQMDDSTSPAPEDRQQTTPLTAPEPVFRQDEISRLDAPALATVDEADTQTDFNYQQPAETEEADVAPVSEQTDVLAEERNEADASATFLVKPAETDPQPVPSTADKPVIKQPDYSADERELMAASGVVIQLLGSYNRAGALDFIARWQGKVSGRLYLYRTRHNNKDWHVVVAGIYPNRDKAKQAVAAMPGLLRQQSPWVKDVQAVGKLLKQRP
ncbi:SPOR domain-containing protein [Bacterioplanoides pacificum]|uniref:SPOR domain-containing protein n=1 Tax=Bacterioplanoides pacificum TaxID=1171596 RepID=A0ABV7VU69_9GAMM